MSNLDEAVKVVKEGGVILYLSDTIWGIGCDPRNADAVEKVREIKNRPSEKSFIVLISEIGQLYDYVSKIPEICWDLVEFAEKPLTVIYPQAKNLPETVTAEDGSVGIRLVKDDNCSKLVKKLRFGLLSTSANVSGSPSPMSYNEIDQRVLNGVDYIVTSALESKKEASKIVKVGLGGEFKIIRN